MGMNLKNTLCTMPPFLSGDFMQSLSSFLISLISGDPHVDALIIGLFKRYNLKGVVGVSIET